MENRGSSGLLECAGGVFRNRRRRGSGDQWQGISRCFRVGRAGGRDTSATGRGAGSGAEPRYFGPHREQGRNSVGSASDGDQGLGANFASGSGYGSHESHMGSVETRDRSGRPKDRRNVAGAAAGGWDRAVEHRQLSQSGDAGAGRRNGARNAPVSKKGGGAGDKAISIARGEPRFEGETRQTRQGRGGIGGGE